jgi:hypothetical protein
MAAFDLTEMVEHRRLGAGGADIDADGEDVTSDHARPPAAAA